MSDFSHIDDKNRPAMVNVGDKDITLRVARARAVVHLPPEVMSKLEEGEFSVKKGPVFETAILAGVMAAKKTSDLIPLCHPIGLNDCKVDISVNEHNEVMIDTRCEAYDKTGVEMEALTAATVAALTIYDMCKGLSHDIVIKEISLQEKRGGKRSFNRGS